MSTEDTPPETTAEPAAPVAVVAAPMPEPLKGVTKANPLCTIGRRKKAQARLRIWPGDGKFTVNGKKAEEYFYLKADNAAARRPLEMAGLADKYDVWVRVEGGGPTGQADATSLAVARALMLLVPPTMKPMRDAGLLTRDARVKERKKYGRRGARRGFQFSKR